MVNVVNGQQQAVFRVVQGTDPDSFAPWPACGRPALFLRDISLLRRLVPTSRENRTWHTTCELSHNTSFHCYHIHHPAFPSPFGKGGGMRATSGTLGCSASRPRPRPSPKGRGRLRPPSPKRRGRCHASASSSVGEQPKARPVWLATPAYLARGADLP